MTQGAYYLVSGVWSVAHIDSFQKVTGRKTDLWLVKTVGLLLVAIGGGLIVAGATRQFVPGLVFIAMASAAALLAIELVYVLRRVISAIYLADALVELGFLIWWAAYLM
ncbi:MAG: hypothetical protein ACJ8G4_09620 [Burkholderiales bacterium]